MKIFSLILALLLIPSLAWPIAFSERDPQVGTVTSGGLCQGDGSAVQCDTTTAVNVTATITGGLYMLTKSASCTIGVDCDGTATKVAYGGIIYVTSAATITLPAVGAGMSITVITIGATAVSVDANAADKIWLDGTALDDGDKITNLSTTGDTAVCTYYSADGWFCKTNSWTDGG